MSTVNMTVDPSAIATTVPSASGGADFIPASPPMDSNNTTPAPPNNPPKYHDPTVSDDSPCADTGLQGEFVTDSLDETDVGKPQTLEEGVGGEQNPRNYREEHTTIERRSGEQEIGSSELIEEIRRLREKVCKIEERAKPRPSYSMLEAEWRTARELSDTYDEQRLWNWFLEQKKEFAENPESVRPYQGRTYTLDLTRLAREMYEDPVYESDVLRWRKSWERKFPPLKLMAAGDERYFRLRGSVRRRFREADYQEFEDERLGDSDSDGSLDLEYNLTILHQKYLKKVDRLYEERDVMLQQKLVKEEERARELKRLQERRTRAQEELQAAGKAEEECEVQATDASGPFSGSDQDTVEEVPKDQPPPSHAFPKLNRVGWIGFKALQDVREEDSFAIDVLVGEPVISIGFPHRAKRTTKTKWGGEKEEVSQDIGIIAKQPAALTGQPPLPERIRIHSKHLIRILEKIHGESIDSAGSLVIIRPFRVLMYYNQALRDWCQKLEKKFGSSDISKSTLTSMYGCTDIPPPNADRLKEATVQREATEELMKEEPSINEQTEKDDAEKPEDDDPDDDSTSSTALQHLRCLLEFMDTDIANKLTYLRDPSSLKVFFSDIWHLFKPGDEVIASDGKQVYRVIGITSAAHKVASYGWAYWTQPSVDEDTPIVIDCVYVDFDGKRLGPIRKQFVIKRFDNEKAVTSLEVYPLRFHGPRRGQMTDAAHSGENFRQQLVSRGRKFADIAVATHKHMYYAGQALETREDIESQVVVDFELALSAEENKDKKWRPIIEETINIESQEEKEKDPCRAECCRNENIHDDSFVEKKRNQEYVQSLFPETREKAPSVSIFPRSVQAIKSSEDELSEEDLIIMSYRVFAFVLRTRKWEKLDLTHLGDVRTSERGTEDAANEEKGKTAFDRLVLPKDHKEMVESLIAQHFRDKESSQSKADQFDIVRGKGKGLILLLHGAPGVGKTSTAEGVAELFKKPLFQITCGDLGTTAAEVEKALETNFALANRWGSILLLDEADVFLSARNPKDFVRNGLVAVFLRVLEYYAGILFLTTNRIGDFDEAFASRIHISLYYPPLDQDSTEQVFNLNLEMIEERMKNKNRDIEIKKADIIKFAGKYWKRNEKARWNGRQIRNACQTALALAEFEAHGGSAVKTLKPDTIVKLKAKHVKQVALSYLEFTKYLRELYGTDDNQRAVENGIRAYEHEHEFHGHRSRPQHLEDLASKFASSRRKRATDEGSHRMSDYRMPPQRSGYSEQRPRASKQRNDSPVSVPVSDDSFSDGDSENNSETDSRVDSHSEEDESEDDHARQHSLHVSDMTTMRGPPGDDNEHRRTRQGVHGSGRLASRSKSRYDGRPSDVAYESFHEGLAPPKKSRDSKIRKGRQ